MAPETHLVEEYWDHGIGFPVMIRNVEVAKVGGHEVPLIDYRRLEQILIEHLPGKRGRLTGNELRFIRLHLGKTLAEFGKLFDVTHAGVKRWETRGQDGTGMNWSTEKDIRLYVLSARRRSPASFVKLYERLADKPTETGPVLALEWKRVRASMPATA